MKQVMKLGVTDRTVCVFIPDPASTDGSGKTGLNAAALTVSYTRVETDNDVVVTDATSSLNDLSALTDAHNDWGVKEVSSTLAPGLYRLDIADAVFASGAWSAVVYVMITTSAAAASPMEFILVAYDQLDGVRLGLTALPNAAADAAGGLVISDAGGLDADAQRADVAAILVDTAEIGTAGAGLTNINLPNQTMDIVGNITGNLTGSVGSVTGAVGSVTGSVGSVTGSVGSVVGLTASNLDATVSSRATPAQVNTEADTALADVGLTTTVTGRIDVAVSTRLASASYTTPPTAADNADAVWDEALAGHAVAGSAGAALSAAGSAGDPWSTPLPGAYGAGTAGKIIGDNVNATISSRSSHAAADIWAVATRILTAGTNIVLAKGVGVTGFNDLSAAQVNTEADTALSDVGLTSTVTGRIDVAVSTRLASASYTAPPSAATIAAAVWAVVIDGTRTATELARGWTAALLGKASGLETTNAKYRNIADTKDVIDATVDVDGNRTAVTLDLS